MGNDEPSPQIVITCARVSLPTGQFRLQPTLAFYQIPGGWSSVHTMLLDCVQQVVAKMVEEAQGQQKRLVEVAQAMPRNGQRR